MAQPLASILKIQVQNQQVNSSAKNNKPAGKDDNVTLNINESENTKKTGNVSSKNTKTESETNKDDFESTLKKKIEKDQKENSSGVEPAASQTETETKAQNATKTSNDSNVETREKTKINSLLEKAKNDQSVNTAVKTPVSEKVNVPKGKAETHKTDVFDQQANGEINAEKTLNANNTAKVSREPKDQAQNGNSYKNVLTDGQVKSATSDSKITNGENVNSESITEEAIKLRSQLQKNHPTNDETVKKTLKETLTPDISTKNNEKKPNVENENRQTQSVLMADKDSRNAKLKQQFSNEQNPQQKDRELSQSQIQMNSSKTSSDPKLLLSEADPEKKKFGQSRNDFSQILSADHHTSDPQQISAQSVKATTQPASRDLMTTVSQQIQESIKASLDRGNHEVTIRLNPPELGKVNIKIHETDGQLTAVLEVSKPETRYQIQQGLSEVVKNLNASGIQIKRFEVLTSNTDSNDSALKERYESFAQQHHDGHFSSGENRSGSGHTFSHSALNADADSFYDEKWDAYQMFDENAVNMLV